MTLKAIICAVIVVPILAPIIIPIDWLRFIKPAEIKPTTNTVVTDEDCMIEVTAAPAAAPVKRLVVSLASICLSLSPAMSFKAIDMRSMPKRKSAKPPSMPINIGPKFKPEADVVTTVSDARINTSHSIHKIE